MVGKEQVGDSEFTPLTEGDWEELISRIPAKLAKLEVNNEYGARTINVPFIQKEISLVRDAHSAQNRIKNRNEEIHLHHCQSESEWYYYNFYGGNKFPGLEEMIDRKEFITKLWRATRGLNVGVRLVQGGGSDLRIISSLPGSLIALGKKVGLDSG